MILTCASWNLLKGGIDAGDDARMRRIAAEHPDVVMLQELNDWDRDGETVLHRAEELLGGMRGFLAPAERGFHMGVFIRESAGLRVVRTRHDNRRPFWHGAACVITEASGFGKLVLASAHLAPASTATRLAEAEAFKLIAEAGPSISGGTGTLCRSATLSRPAPARTPSTSAAGSTTPQPWHSKPPG